MFDELKASYPDLVVLGWGEKWTGYTDKSKAVIKYIEKMNDDDIVIVIDGFDSKIIKDPKIAVERFIKLGSKVLFSYERNISRSSSFIFRTCKNGVTLNAGIYMGYVKNVKIILNEMMNNYKCKDDQVNFNDMCKKFDFIDIDTDTIIFHNVKSNENQNYKGDACFLGYPGALTLERRLRSFDTTTQFKLFYIILCLLYITLIFPNFGTCITFLFLIWYVAFAEKSCVKTPRLY
jgi:hypothetical protein